MNEMTAAAVKSLNETATPVGYNYWTVGGVKTEIRPGPDGFTFSDWNATGLSSRVALALVREAACRGSEIMLWLCCGCDNKANSAALGRFVSHGLCKPCAAKLRLAALEYAVENKS
jgi:hypothetical protein